MTVRPLPAAIVPYDREAHASYVRESWALAARRDRRELDWWLRRHETRAVVAVVPGESDVTDEGREALILGWAAAVPDEQFLLWVQVKKLWWRRGLGGRLAAAALWHVWPDEEVDPRFHPTRYAYPSRIATAIERAHPDALRFDPTLARRVPRACDWLSPGEVPPAERRR